MFKNLFLIIIFSVMLIGCSYTYDLPKKLASWKLTEQKNFTGKKLFDHINGGADIYYEYGFVQVHVGYYQKDNQEILVERYQMSDPVAAYGIHSLTSDAAAQKLPSPYTGRIYDFYLDCVNGNDYIKIINYDTLNYDERMQILKDLIPNPISLKGLEEIFSILPEERIPGSEVIFRGSLGVRNFCILGQDKSFDFGKSVSAAGCLVSIGTEKYRCIVLSGKKTILTKSFNSFLENIVKKDYEIERQAPIILLEDTLSDQRIFILPQSKKLNFVFNIPLSIEDKLVKLF